MGTKIKKTTRTAYTFLDALGALGGQLKSLTAMFGVLFLPFSSYQFYLMAYKRVFPGKIKELKIRRFDLILLHYANFINLIIPKKSIASKLYSKRVGQIKDAYDEAVPLINQKLDVISVLRDNQEDKEAKIQAQM